MLQPRLARALVISLLVTGGVTVAAGVAAAGPKRGTVATSSAAWPKACVADLLKAAQWFVRELDAGAVSVESGPGWRALRGTTIDEGQTLPVLWLKVEAIDPSSPSAGAVSGWIEVAGAPPGMQVGQLDEDAAAAVLPDTHWEKSLGRWRLVRSLLDGTPKEEALVARALDRCAAALQAPAKRRR